MGVGAFAGQVTAQAARLFRLAQDKGRSPRDMIGALKTGLVQNQFFLVYQPQVDIRSGRITGVEALVRWRHPTGGIVSPATFIPAAEESGFIVPLGQWVLNEACRQAGEWLRAGIAPATLSVNLSAVQLERSHDLARRIQVVLGRNGLPPSMLELELTESALVEKSRRNDECLGYLRKLGIRIAIDDFGTGYSSLLYLRRLPADRIKIAQDFVCGLGTNSGDAAIVRATIGLAREFGKAVIAEGLETERQLALIEAWGCREAQGYYFSRPLSAEDATTLLASGEALPQRPTYAEAV